MTFITQDPTLFKGSIRYNLDPMDKHDDQAILELLKKAGLDELILKKKKEEKENKEKDEKEIDSELLKKAMQDKQDVEDSSLLNFQV